MSTRLPSWLLVATTITGVLTLGLVDWATGFELNFFVFYFAPVSIAAWSLGFPFAVAVAVFSGLTWYGADMFTGHEYSSHGYAVWNMTIRLVSFLAIGWSVSKVKQLLERERESAGALRRALSEVKVLEAFLPICAQCKKIRDKECVWQHMEVYIGQHANTQFSHGYCPECARKAMEEAGLTEEKTEQQGGGYSPPAVLSSKPTP